MGGLQNPVVKRSLDESGSRWKGMAKQHQARGILQSIFTGRLCPGLCASEALTGRRACITSHLLMPSFTAPDLLSFWFSFNLSVSPGNFFICNVCVTDLLLSSNTKLLLGMITFLRS